MQQYRYHPGLPDGQILMPTLPRKHDIQDMIVRANPYAFLTVTLNQEGLAPNVARRRLRFAAKSIGLWLDQRYLNDRCASRRRASERFNAIGVFEKLAGNPHMHLACFATDRSSQEEREDRSDFC